MSGLTRNFLRVRLVNAPNIEDHHLSRKTNQQYFFTMCLCFYQHQNGRWQGDSMKERSVLYLVD